MISLETATVPFETTLLTEQGYPIRGTVQPIEDMKIYPDDYNYVRTLFRTRPPFELQAGMVLKDLSGQRHILGTWDVGYGAAGIIYRSFVMYPCNVQVAWDRPTTTKDSLTGVPRGKGITPLGPIWALKEVLVREAPVNTVQEELFRVVVGADVDIQDLIDGKRIRKINMAHGVRILEVV